MKIALAQLNPTVGDLRANSAAVLAAIDSARAQGAELAVFAEQTLLGYSAKDLLLRDEIIAANLDALRRVAARCEGIAAIVGYAEPNESGTGRPLFNSAALLSGGRVVANWRKQLLPTYDVFDEARYFEPAGPQPVAQWHGQRLAVTICEDLLAQALHGRSLYRCDPIDSIAADRPDVLVNIAASPFVLGKHAWRTGRMAEAAGRARCLTVCVNQVGGNDDVLFDGASLAIDGDARVVGQARAFAEDLLLIDTHAPDGSRREATLTGPAELHAALVMGLRDYVRKCGFSRVLVGLSGGIDSSVVAALAVDALGAQAVHGVALPSRYSSDHSLEDARELAARLAVQLSVVPIEPAHAALGGMLAEELGGAPSGLTDENLQARIRGTALMALSNHTGAMLLTTGNKSEMAAGYCTLYGDMCGGLAVLSDVPKTMIYALARWMNQRGGVEIIPERCLTKPPSAELRPNQTDQDTLPPYESLDAVLERYEERWESPDRIVAAGFEPHVVRDTVARLAASEYKRQQAAIGLKVTARAFGFGRRMPVAARVTMPELMPRAAR